MDKDTACKHHWILTTRGTVYFECAICRDRWNAERLVNALQNKVERQEKQIKNLKCCGNCEHSKWAMCQKTNTAYNAGCYNNGYKNWEFSRDRGGSGE